MPGVSHFLYTSAGVQEDRTGLQINTRYTLNIVRTQNTSCNPYWL